MKTKCLRIKCGVTESYGLSEKQKYDAQSELKGAAEREGGLTPFKMILACKVYEKDRLKRAVFEFKLQGQRGIEAYLCFGSCVLF